MNEFDFGNAIKNMFDTNSEKAKERHLNLYNESLNTPENFSKWFSDLVNAMEKTKTTFKYPKSYNYIFDLEEYDSIRKDVVDKDIKDKLNQLLIDKFQLDKDKTYFIKTGLFSNKFEFNQPKVTDINSLMENYLSIQYMGLLVGAYTTSEIVIREYIEPVEDVSTIYEGMPLRTEFRVFVDIQGEESKVLGTANYWHPEEMHTISDVYEQIKDDSKEILEENLKALESSNIKSPKLNRLRDLITYMLAEEEIQKTFNQHKDMVEQEVLRIAKNIESETLQGKWSLDVMKNGDDFYIIDAARMENSALKQYI